MTCPVFSVTLRLFCVFRSNPARFAVKEYRIISQGLALRVLESGRGRPLLCLHGLGCDHHMFDDLSRELSPFFRVVRMALRGHGRSDYPRRPWSVKDVAGDILAVMDRLDLRQTVLVGHSLGGMAALQAALRTMPADHTARPGSHPAESAQGGIIPARGGMPHTCGCD